jgi:hypothetical protein
MPGHHPAAMPGHHRFDVLQTLREALPCGSAEDMRLAEPGSVAADGGCPEADFMSRVRFNFKALAHVSAAFCGVWKGCGTSTRTRLHAIRIGWLCQLTISTPLSTSLPK